MNLQDASADWVRKDGRQVAALCWRRAPLLEVLLVTSLRTNRWILPKGWPEPGMTLPQSAANEALEEAGVTGVIGARPVGRYHYRKERKNGSVMPCRVDVFALMVTGQRQDWLEKGAREVAWLPVEEASARLDVPALCQIVLAFREKTAPSVRIADSRWRGATGL